MLLRVVTIAIVCAAGCRGDRAETATASSLSPGELGGRWRAALISPGGELPFHIELAGSDRNAMSATIVNGDEAIAAGASIEGGELLIRFPHYDAEIRARRGSTQATLSGEWKKRTPGGNSTLRFRATKGVAHRFVPLPADTPRGSAPASVAGHWRTEFSDEDGTFLARGEFAQDGGRVTGTFLTATGDFRYLEGDYGAGLLRLSTFDGAHAFLFTAQVANSGGGPVMRGYFYSRDVYNASFTARPVAEGDTVLPDPFAEVTVTSADQKLRFAFPDTEGVPMTNEDPRFRGKVVVVDLFGSWCPNCNDEAPVLAGWHRRYRDRGLEIVGLAFEYTGDRERDAEMVRRYKARHGIEFPLLVAGVSDKKQAAAALPDISEVKSYPTTIFVGRDGRVRKIHSGFAGPGTGEHFTRLIAELEGEIERLLAE